MTTIITRLKEGYSQLDAGTRRLLTGTAAALLILLLAYGILQQHLQQLQRYKQSREQTLTDLLSLQQRYREAAADAGRMKNRLSLVTATDSPAAIIQQTGLAAKAGIQVKPLQRQTHDGLVEDDAEVSVSGLTLNELVNLLYRLEQNPKPVGVKRLQAKVKFSDPSRLDATLTLALYRAAPQGQP